MLKKWVIIFKIVVKKYREQSELSQNELAELAGISQSYLNEIENGLKIPKISTLEKIAKALNICINLLIITDNKCDSNLDCSNCIKFLGTLEE